MTLGAVEMRLLPPKPPGKKEGKTITIASSVWETVDRVASETNYSRNEVVEAFLPWAAEEHYKDDDSQASVPQLKREIARLEKLVSELQAKAKK